VAPGNEVNTMFFKKKDSKTGEAILKCPRDGTRMKKLVKEDVILDVCPNCKGMWLDHEEIDKLSAIASQPLKKNHTKKGTKKNGKKKKT
jgi:Zn-finger nucleic acid-binding protein